MKETVSSAVIVKPVTGETTKVQHAKHRPFGKSLLVLACMTLPACLCVGLQAVEPDFRIGAGHSHGSAAIHRHRGEGVLQQRRGKAKLAVEGEVEFMHPRSSRRGACNDADK